MTRSQILTLTAAVLTTVADLDPEPAPEGPIYAYLMQHGIGLADYETIRDALVTGGLIARGAGHTLRITPAGRMTAREITEAAQRRAAEIAAAR